MLLNELSKSDRVALGMLIQCFNLKVSMKNSVRNVCGHKLFASAEIGLRKSTATKQLLRDFLLRREIQTTEGNQVTDTESLLKLLDLLKPWVDYFPSAQPIKAAEYILMHPPPHDDIPAFREYVAHVDSIL